MPGHKIIHTTVFSLKSGGGNPCPVVLNADNLSTKEMQQMTKDFAHETSFVLQPTHPDCDVKLRFFVPLHEMEMCVHATIGSVTVLVRRGLIKQSPVMIETLLGSVKVDWEINDSKIDVKVEQFSPQFMDLNPSKQQVAKALGIGEDQFIDIPIQSVSTSRHKLIVPLKSVETLSNLKSDFEYLWQLCDQYETTGFYPFAVEDKTKRQVQARQFPKRAGYNEDPATGVAASALGAYLTKYNVLNSSNGGWNPFQIIQGVSMGRPSVIITETFLNGEKMERTRVIGRAVINDSLLNIG